MNYVKENIKEIERQGFETLNFCGYGGTGYRKENIELWWHEWGNVYIELVDTDIQKRINVCQIGKEPIKEKLYRALNEMNDFINIYAL